MLSPSAQLKVDKLPHHEGLREADGCQDGHPNRREATNMCMIRRWKLSNVRVKRSMRRFIKLHVATNSSAVCWFLVSSLSRISKTGFKHPDCPGQVTHTFRQVGVSCCLLDWTGKPFFLFSYFSTSKFNRINSANKL